MFKVVLVESDPMVRHIGGEYIRGDGRFAIAGEFSGGREAVDFLEKNRVDLVVLELLLPGYSGLDLMRDLLNRYVDTNVIVVTAANDARSLEEAMQLGALDYILKPFTQERVAQALDRFAAYMETWGGLRVTDQETIDFLMRHGENTEKSVCNRTEERIINCFSGKKGLGVKEIAGAVGLSEVTVRRYLKRMVQAGRLLDEMDYSTGGHPRAVYRLP